MELEKRHGQVARSENSTLFYSNLMKVVAEIAFEIQLRASPVMITTKMVDCLVSDLRRISNVPTFGAEISQLKYQTGDLMKIFVEFYGVETEELQSLQHTLLWKEVGVVGKSGVMRGHASHGEQYLKFRCQYQWMVIGPDGFPLSSNALSHSARLQDLYQ